MERRQPSMSIESPDAVTDAGTRSSVPNEGAPRAEPFDVPTHVRHLAKIAVIVSSCKSELIDGAHAVHFPRTHLSPFFNPLINYKNPAALQMLISFLQEQLICAISVTLFCPPAIPSTSPRFTITMSTAMATFNVASRVQALNAVSSGASQVHLSSVSRLAGFRLTSVAHSGVSLRTAGRPATVVVRADDSITGNVQEAVGGAARKVQETAGAAKDKVQDAAGAAKGKLEDAGNYLSGKADEAQDKAQDAGKDAQRQVEKLGDKAADAGRDVEGSAKNASRDARGEAENIGDKAQNAIEDAGDSLKRSADKATSAAKDAGKDVQRKAEDAGDSAKDTATDLKKDAQKGADRISN